MATKLIAGFALREGAAVFFMGLALFWSAGRIDWWPAWALIAVSSAWSVGTTLAILRHGPDLLAERLRPRKGAKRWDQAIMSIHAILQLATFIVAGLDHRYGWTGALPLATQVAALITGSLAYSFAVWATASNPFFSKIVRIQTDRGHTVAAAGPYRLVRHPAYAGAVLTLISVPVLLASRPALVIGSVDAILMILRTALEDRTLQAELPGYREYARQVHHRLLPGIW